jgi:ketosteroid isomerase-like protein
MSQAVRQQVTLFEERPRRSLDEKVAALFPPLGWRFAALLFRLPPASPVRRRFVATLVRRGYAALNRRDLELNAKVLYDRDSVLFIHGNIPIGSGPYRGGEEIIQGYREWQDVWAEQRRVPREIVDLGERLVVVLDDTGEGAGSGVSVRLRFTDVITVRNGRIHRHEVYPDWEAGMRAAGLSE